MWSVAATRNDADPRQRFQIKQVLVGADPQDPRDFVAGAMHRVAENAAGPVTAEPHFAGAFRYEFVRNPRAIVTHNVLVGLIGWTNQSALDEVRIAASAPGTAAILLISGRCHHAVRCPCSGRESARHRVQFSPPSGRWCNLRRHNWKP